MAEERNFLPAELEARVGEVIKGLPPDKGSQLKSILIQAVKSHRGPLPDPETLEKYNGIIENGAERLMRIVEKEQEHRHELDKRMVTAEIRFGTRGQLIAAVLATLFGAGAIYLGNNDHDWLAAIMATTTIGSVVTVFVLGRRTEPGDVEESEPRPDQKGKSEPRRGKRQ